MKKISLWLLAFAVSGCCSQPAENNWFQRITSGPDCCNHRTVSFAPAATNVYTVSSSSAMYAKYYNQQPEIYDPQPLPPLRIYHTHKSRPHHYVAEYYNYEPQGKVEQTAAKPQVTPQKPRKL